MKSTLTDLDDNKVKLTVEVEESEFDTALDETFKKIAREVRIPGFRPGKVPRRILEARLGPGVARSEALRDAIPDYYGEALREHDVDAIASPEIDITDGAETGDVVFDAVVEVRPRISIAGYDDLAVELPSPSADDDEIDEQIDRIRGQFAEFEDVDRPAVDGDHVLVDITGSQDGEELAGLTADDYSYEVGSEGLVVELDENLRGAKVGDIIDFGADHPSGEGSLDFRILVKGVREKAFPELTDEWAAENTEFESVQELRVDAASSITDMKRSRASRMVRDRLAAALVELVDVEPPEALVASFTEDNLQNMAMSLQAQGIGLEQWLQLTGTEPEQFREQLSEGAMSSAKADLALRSVAEAEGIVPTAEQIDTEIEHTAMHLDITPDEVRSRLDAADGLLGMRAELTKRQAMDWLLERARFVTEDGDSIDRELLDWDVISPTDQHDHDHEGHDHEEDEQ